MTTPASTPAPQPVHSDTEAQPCAECVAKRALVVSLRWEFRRHHLSEHERLMADWLLDLTLVKGRERVKIARLGDLASLSGIDKSHVHRALKSLGEMRIITSELKDGVVELRINQETDSWKCRFRQSRAQITEALNIIAATNGNDAHAFQAGLEDPESFFEQGGEGFFMPESVAVSATGPGTFAELPPLPSACETDAL